MVSLAVVFHRQFPVAARGKRQSRVADTRVQLRPAARPYQLYGAFLQLCSMLLERRRIAAQVDEHDSHEGGAAHRLQTMCGIAEALGVVLVHTADMRRRLQIAVRGVRPAVITTGDHPADIARFRNELHPTMAADIVKYPQCTVSVAHHEEWQAHEVEWKSVRALGQGVAEHDPCPGAGEHGIALVEEVRVAGVREVRQPGCLTDRA
jgi:hypothetical protein